MLNKRSCKIKPKEVVELKSIEEAGFFVGEDLKTNVYSITQSPKKTVLKIWDKKSLPKDYENCSEF